MKTVIFMRHGKAADYNEYDSDFERPLVRRGKEEVKEAVEKLKSAGISPDVIIASPAFRTAMTARIAADVFSLNTENIVYSSGLYMGSEAAYLTAASESNGNVILIAGHNPATGNLAMHFGAGKIIGYPTSSVSVFRFSDSVIEPQSNAELIHFDTRK